MSSSQIDVVINHYIHLDAFDAAQWSFDFFYNPPYSVHSVFVSKLTASVCGGLNY